MSLYESIETPEAVEYDVEWVVDDVGINIRHLSVPAALRREGRGQATVKAILAAANNDGVEYAVANVGGGAPTARFFEDLGFRVLEQERDHVTAVADPIEDIIN